MHDSTYINFQGTIFKSCVSNPHQSLGCYLMNEKVSGLWVIRRNIMAGSMFFTLKQAFLVKYIL